MISFLLAPTVSIQSARNASIIPNHLIILIMHHFLLHLKYVCLTRTRTPSSSYALDITVSVSLFSYKSRLSLTVVVTHLITIRTYIVHVSRLKRASSSVVQLWVAISADTADRHWSCWTTVTRMSRYQVPPFSRSHSAVFWHINNYLINLQKLIQPNLKVCRSYISHLNGIYRESQIFSDTNIFVINSGTSIVVKCKVLISLLSCRYRTVWNPLRPIPENRTRKLNKLFSPHLSTAVCVHGNTKTRLANRERSFCSWWNNISSGYL